MYVGAVAAGPDAGDVEALVVTVVSSSRVMRRAMELWCLGQVEAVEEAVEVVAGVGPVEWCCGLAVAVLRAEDSFGEFAEIAEIVGADGFSLQDR